MFYALNKAGIRIDAYEADKNEQYTCPICNNRVILKRGSVNIDHFAHESNLCEDNWNYDMSEWHKRMQSYFPIESREVIVKSGDKIHRADVLIENTVIEFQHSPISVDEYEERNRFFGSLGYRVAWVFDVSQQYMAGDLYYSSDNNLYLLTWKNPIRIFAYSPFPSDYDKKFAIWFYTGETNDSDYIQRVIWSAEDEYTAPSFKKIIFSEYSITLDESFDVKQFFMSRNDHFNEALRELQSKYTYEIKYSGVRGMSMDSYVCPKTNKFGIDLYRENGCSNCRYCYMMTRKKRKDTKIEIQVYCCFPNQVWEENVTHEGYDYGRPNVYNV